MLSCVKFFVQKMGFGKEKPYSLLPSIDAAAADCDWFTSTEETSLSV